MAVAQARNQLQSVQYLRGLAAVTVVAAHAFAYPLPGAPLGSWFAGMWGVTLFFVISGFIMVLISGKGRFDPGRFMHKRIVRIVPLYWLVTLVVAALSLIKPAATNNTVFDVPHLIGSLLFIPMYRPAEPDTIEPFIKLGWRVAADGPLRVVRAGDAGVGIVALPG